MVTRIGHMALNVGNLDRAVDFQQRVVGMTEVERFGGAACLTCNDRHHELILVENPADRGYDHIGLEVADAQALEAALTVLPRAGGTLLGGIYDGEPGIDRALKVRSPGGHVYKLFCGMETVDVELPEHRPTHFEHVSTKVRRPRAEERFFTEGLGFKLADRMGFLASWWHCNEDHHGLALIVSPRPELHHYAYAYPDLGAVGRVADNLLAARDRKCIYGPSRHGPGNNHFLYFHDEDGAMIECCSELAQMTRDAYVPKTWSMKPTTINQWGAPPPAKFILTGFPVASPTDGRAAWASRLERTHAR